MNHPPTTKRHSLHRVGRVLLFCILALTFTWLVSEGRDDITVPDADNTPPTVMLIVRIADEDEFVLTSDSLERGVDGRDTITFTAIARDEDGGVRYVRLFGRVVVECLGDDHDQHIVTILRTDNPSDAGPGDRAQIERTTSLTVSIQPHVEGCPDDFSYHGLEGDIEALAVNFHGGDSLSAPFYFDHRETRE